MSKGLRLFSDVVNGSVNFEKFLRNSSVSQEDAKNRKSVYERVFSNLDEVSAISKIFSGSADMQILSNQYVNAAVMSYVNSFAGYIAIERALDQPNMLIQWLDVLNVSDDSLVLPNIGGPEAITGRKSEIKFSSATTASQAAYTSALGRSIVPGSVKIVYIKGTDAPAIVITDDRNGNLITKAGVLKVGTVAYKTGTWNVEFNTDFVPADANGAIQLTAFEDLGAAQNSDGAKNRFKVKNQNQLMAAQGDMLVGEYDLMSLASSKKSLGIDPLDFLTQKLTELFTKTINQSMVDTLVGNYEGNVVELDLKPATTSYGDYQSTVQDFTGKLIDVDSDLAKKSIKGVKATAYVVGNDVASMFRKTKITGSWEDKPDTNYVNDLVGFYDGAPVLRHLSIPDGEGYAIHKTADGNMAPLVRGIYLPLTDTPVVGNYDNPAQQAKGVFYSEAHDRLQNGGEKLVTKFNLVTK